MALTNPDSRLELIMFAEAHTDVWDTAYASIGLTSAQASEYKTATNEARSKYNAAQAARQAAKNATLDQNQAVKNLRNLNSNLIRIIRGYAGQSTDPTAVYTSADIAPPKPPAPLGNPNAPFDLTANLDLLNGGLVITWKNSQPVNSSGVVFRVERSTGNNTWSQVGLTGEKKFNDVNIPAAATTRLMYRVIAQRGAFVSVPSAVLDIRFATNSQGETVINAIKLAA